MTHPFGWDFPPGVTGNEPEIAGYPEELEGEHCDLCNEQATEIVTHDIVQGHIGYYCKEHSDDYSG